MITTREYTCPATSINCNSPNQCHMCRGLAWCPYCRSFHTCRCSHHVPPGAVAVRRDRLGSIYVHRAAGAAVR